MKNRAFLFVLLFIHALAFAAEAKVKSIYLVPKIPNITVPKADAKDKDGKANFRGYLDSLASQIHFDAMQKIKASIQKIDPKVYNAHLESLNGYTESNSDSIAHYQKEFQSILQVQDEKKQYQKLRSFNKTILGKSPDFYWKITAPTMKMDSKGILQSGFIPNPIKDQNRVVLQIKKANAKALILKPQALTAWPGDSNTIIEIIEPKDGPWNVVAGVSQGKVIGRQLDLFTVGRKLKSVDFLDFKLNDYVLLQSQSSEEVIGWVSLDEATIELTKIAGWDFYKKGYAAALQGWYKEKDVQDHNFHSHEDAGEYGNGDCDILLQPGQLYYYNFAHLVRIQHQPNISYYSINESYTQATGVIAGKKPYVNDVSEGQRISKIWFKGDYLYANLLMKIDKQEYTFEKSANKSIQFHSPGVRPFDIPEGASDEWQAYKWVAKLSERVILQHFGIQNLEQLFISE